MFSFLWSLIVGGVLGAIGGMILGKDVPGGMIGNIIVGFLGSWIGSNLLGTWGSSNRRISNFTSTYWSNHSDFHLFSYCWKPQ